MTRGLRTGILGGTFDPIHVGHLAVAAAARRRLGLDRVWLTPAAVPPHRAAGPAASAYHRFAMVALACSDGDAFDPCDIELDRPGPSYTADTLRRLQASGPAAAGLFFLSGADAFAEIATWRDYPAVLSLANFVVTSRPGLEASGLPARLPELAPRMHVLADNGETPGDTPTPLIYLMDCPTPDVSSTGIRARIREGRTITGLVPPAVDDYIRRHGLYGASPVSDGAAGPDGRPFA